MSVSLIALGLLMAGEPAINTAPADRSGDERMRCRKYADIGSLVKTRKVCRTVSQWRKVDDAARATGRDMQERGMGGPPPNG